MRAFLQARRLWNSAVKSAPATLSGDSEQHKKIDVQIKPAEGDRQSRGKELGAKGEWGKSCTHVTYSSCVFMSWTHVLHSWPTLMLCTPVVCFAMLGQMDSCFVNIVLVKCQFFAKTLLAGSVDC